MKKISKRIMIVPLLLSAGISLFPLNVGAEAVPDTSASESTGWIKEAGKWKYINSNGDSLVGWHYVPVKNAPEKSDWFLFDSDGHMVTFRYGKPDEIFGTMIDDPKSDLEPAVIKNGWYEVEGKDGYYLDTTMTGDYRISKYSNGTWTYLDTAGVSENGGKLSTNDKNDENTQKWWISANNDGSYMLLNEATGLQLALNGNDLSGYKGTDKKSIHLKRAGARPEYYGAAGDGVTDDTEAIIRTINANPVVEFKKRYNTSKTITVEKDNMTFIGSDSGMIVTHPNFFTFRVKGKNVKFDGVNFMGSYTRNESSDYSCIDFRTEKDDEDVVDYNALINNCKFINTGLRGIHIHSERVSKSDYTPLRIASNFTIKDCTFDGHKIGVCCSGPDNVVVDHCNFSNAYYEHITFDWRSRHCKAINNTFNGLEGGIGAIGVDSAEDIEIRGNDFYYSVLYGITLSSETRTNKNITIADNTFTYTGGKAGVNFGTYGKNGASAEDVLIENNTFNTKNSFSIAVYSAGKNVVFSGNKYNGNTPSVFDSSAQIVKDY